MLIKEGFCLRNSNSSLQHIRNYDRLLMAALMHTKTVYPDKYGAVLKEQTKEQQPEPPTKACPRQHSDSNSDSTLLLQKRAKVTETKTSFEETFYRFILGRHTLTSADASVTWQPKEKLHEELGATIISAGSIFDTKTSAIRQNWDEGLTTASSNI